MNEILNKKMELLTKTFNELTAKQEKLKEQVTKLNEEFQLAEAEKMRLQGEYRGLQTLQSEMNQPQEPLDIKGKDSVKTSELTK